MRYKRSRHELLGDILAVLVDGPMNRNQIRLATKLGGQHLVKMLKVAEESGLIEWIGEPSRLNQEENYGRNIQLTKKGGQWSDLWGLLMTLLDPRSKLNVTVQRRQKVTE